MAEADGPDSVNELRLTVGKSLVVDSPVNIQRVSVANPAMAEAVAITPKELLVNGLTPGETTLIIWQQGGNRLFYDLRVRQSNRGSRRCAPNSAAIWRARMSPSISRTTLPF